MEVKENFPLMKWKRIFDLMFPKDTKLPASTPSLPSDYYVPPPNVYVCTCICILGIRMPKK
jgi:hypothetical protein